MVDWLRNDLAIIECLATLQHTTHYRTAVSVSDLQVRVFESRSRLCQCRCVLLLLIKSQHLLRLPISPVGLPHQIISVPIIFLYLYRTPVSSRLSVFVHELSNTDHVASVPLLFSLSVPLRNGANVTRVGTGTFLFLVYKK